jgi:hypothetical protein
MPSGVSGASWTVSWARFDGCSEIYFGHPDPTVNLTRWQQLDGHRDQIIAAYGDDLIFDAPTEKRVVASRPASAVRRSPTGTWPDMLTWLIDSQIRFRTAIASVGGVPVAASALSSADENDVVET